MSEEVGLRLEAAKLAVKVCEIDNTYEFLTIAETIYKFLKGVLPNE